MEKMGTHIKWYHTHIYIYIWHGQVSIGSWSAACSSTSIKFEQKVNNCCMHLQSEFLSTYYIHIKGLLIRTLSVSQHALRVHLQGHPTFWGLKL